MRQWQPTTDHSVQTADPVKSTERWRDTLVATGCALWAIACFVPSWGFGFVSWDDALHLLDNPLVLAPRSHPLAEHLLTPSLGYPSPLGVLSYRIEYAWFGLDSATPYHVTNTLLYGGVVALVYRLARTLGLGIASSALGALVFGLHPVVAEPVSWISGRKDLLAALFGLAALLLGMKHRLDWQRPRAWAVLAFFVLAVASKPVAAYVALVLPVWRLLGCRPEVPPARDSATCSWHSRAVRAAVEVLPLLVLTLVLVPIAWSGQARTRSLRLDEGPLLVARTAWYALGFHLRLLMGLEPHSAKYLPPAWPAPFTASVDLVPLLVIPPMVWLAIRCTARRRRAALAGLSYALVAYLPNSNLIPLTRVLADVYAFVPMIGFGWWLAAISEGWLQAWSSRVVRALPAVLTGSALTLVTLPVSAHWRDSVALWQNAYELYPADGRLCRNLGNAYFELEGPARALAQYETCARRFGRAGFEKNIGLSLAALGHRKAAREALERAQKLHPKDSAISARLRSLRERRNGSKQARDSTDLGARGSHVAE